MREDVNSDQTTLNNPGDRTLLQADGAAAPESPQRKASLIVLSGWEIGRQIAVHGQGQILGRSPLAHTTINAPSVSRQHLRIDRRSGEDGEVFEVTDLNSSNGTMINHRRITASRIGNGDKLKLGDVVFKFVLEDEIDSRFHEQVHRLIHYDQLTGLLTLDAFRSRFDMIVRDSGPDTAHVLAMTDLDGLKRVNDTHGHLAGRMAVREMGAILRACMEDGGVAGLYGGDEAVVLYPGIALPEARARAEIIRSRIAERIFEHQGQRFQVSISQGLAEWPRHGAAFETLLSAADRALYAAKAAGRDCVRWPDSA